MWRQVRILILLLILGIAAWSNYYDRLSTTDWDETLSVGIFPLDDAGDPVAREYVAGLTTADVADVETFLNEQAASYGISTSRPVSVTLYPVVKEQPPERSADSGIVGNMWWSLRMRMYARRASRESGLPAPQIRIFVRFHNPAYTQTAPHSVGMQKGLVGMVHAFASSAQADGNNVVIAHEILHTLGATDKYDTVSLAPLFPVGYAEPDRQPLFPQRFTEIMAGRYAISEHEYLMPRSLDEVLVGKATAIEINWVDP